MKDFAHISLLLARILVAMSTCLKSGTSYDRGRFESAGRLEHHDFGTAVEMLSLSGPVVR
jgi:hypothetical protein